MCLNFEDTPLHHQVLMNNHEFSLPRHFLKRHIIDRHSVGLRPEAVANFAREFFLHTAFSAHQATTRNVRKMYRRTSQSGRLRLGGWRGNMQLPIQQSLYTPVSRRINITIFFAESSKNCPSSLLTTIRSDSDFPPPPITRISPPQTLWSTPQHIALLQPTLPATHSYQ
jgi:hypothetical protein